MFEIIFQIPDHVPAHRPATLVLCSLGSHRKVGKYSEENDDIADYNILCLLCSHRKVNIHSGENNNIDDNNILCSLGSHQKVGKRTSRENHSRNINTTFHLKMKSQCNIFGKSCKLSSEFIS